MNFKHTLVIYALLSMSGSICHVAAQSIKYPTEVKELYNTADKAAMLTNYPRPVIGVPTTPDTKAEVAAVEKAGGIAIIIPSTVDPGALRDIAGLLDGLVLSQGVQASDKYSVLLNKVASDRNIPVLGDNALMAKIDSGLWRMHDNCRDYASLIDCAKLFKRAKNLHQRMFTVDTHADLPEGYDKGNSIGLRKTNQVSIQKMEEGMLDAEFIIDFIGDGAKTKEQLDNAEAKCKKILQQIYDDVEKYKDFCAIAKTPAEAMKIKSEGKKALFIGMENGAGLGADINNVKWYADRGVTYITLCWMKDNAICHSSSIRYKDNDPSKGLTEYGKKVVRQMNKHGVIVDVSHTSEQTFWDCIKVSKTPIICSHSGCMANHTHDRNITDEQIRALAQKGGVLQVYAVWNFQGKDKYKTTIKNMVADIDHAVRIGGVDHVGIGADFDGGGGYTGIMAENDFINITMELMKKGYSDEDIAKIMGGNIMRVMTEVQQYAKKQ